MDQFSINGHFTANRLEGESDQDFHRRVLSQIAELESLLNNTQVGKPGTIQLHMDDPIREELPFGNAHRRNTRRMFNAYVAAVIRSESADFEMISKRICESPTAQPFSQATHDHSMLRIQHALMGMTSEVGELVEIFKKYFYYGLKPGQDDIDFTHVFEEIGDLFWYIGIFFDAISDCIPDDGGATPGDIAADVMIGNIKKLMARYPDKFNVDDARTRDLEAERAALQDGINQQTSKE